MCCWKRPGKITGNRDRPADYGCCSELHHLDYLSRTEYLIEIAEVVIPGKEGGCSGIL